jgi:hypothetical protein
VQVNAAGVRDWAGGAVKRLQPLLRSWEWVTFVIAMAITSLVTGWPAVIARVAIGCALSLLLLRRSGRRSNRSDPSAPIER